MYQINERTTLIVTVSFYDEDDVLVVPSAATYRIDDVASNTAIVALTNFTLPLASQVDITIDAEDNAILDSDHQYEVRTMTVEFNYGTPKKHGTEEYHYRIKQLYGVTDVWASASLSPSASASPS